MDAAYQQKSKNIKLHVKQDFSAINVGPEYTGDDVQPLEEGKEPDGNPEFEDESEEEEELPGFNAPVFTEEFLKHNESMYTIW